MPDNCEEFKGRASEMRDSDWLAAEDLRGIGDVKVVIDKIVRHRNVKFEDGKNQSVVYAIKFKGGHKHLKMKACIRKIMNDARGPKVTDWAGCGVTLYVDESVRFAGKQVGGIRFRPDVIPPGGKHAEPIKPEQVMPEQSTSEQSIEDEFAAAAALDAQEQD